jgi:hypothetical protein
MVHLWKPELNAALKPGTIVLAETARFLLELKPEQCDAFTVKVLRPSFSLHFQ